MVKSDERYKRKGQLVQRRSVRGILKQMRSRGLTYKQIAALTGVPRETVEYYTEKGKSQGQ